jgi:Flp pilus assembly protein TadG
MRRWSRWARNDDGSAALEFITVGIILLVPLVYLVITLGTVQQQMLGVEAAARHAARVIGQAADAQEAAASSDAVLADVVEEYDLDAGSVDVSVTCSPAGRECPTAGATVVVTVSTRVSLPFVPPIFGLDRAASIPLEAAAAQKISRLWGSG